MNQNHVHQYVLEHVARLPAPMKRANRLSAKIAGFAFVLATAIVVITIINPGNFERDLRIALAVLIAGFPFGVLAQRFTARSALHRKNLLIRQFLIGKRTYLVPEHSKLDHELDIFAAASSLVGTASALETTRHAAAWHTYRTAEEKPGVAICLGWFGHNSQPYAFMYGETKHIVEHAAELWDIGHIRPMYATDTEMFMNTAAAWRKQGSLPVAVAFAPLPADTELQSVNIKDIERHLTLLGLLRLEPTRDRHTTFTQQLKSAAGTAAAVQSIAAWTLFIQLLFGLAASAIWSVPMLVSLAHAVIVSMALLPLLLSSISWDAVRHRTAAAVSRQSGDALQASLLISAAVYVQYLAFLGRNNLSTIAEGSTAHQIMTAITLLTIGGCLIFEVLVRNFRSFTSGLKNINPFFVLAAAGSVLILLVAAFAMGPLLGRDLLYVGGSVLAYAGIRMLIAHAHEHHSRDSIIELLSQR